MPYANFYLFLTIKQILAPPPLGTTVGGGGIGLLLSELANFVIRRAYFVHIFLFQIIKKSC